MSWLVAVGVVAAAIATGALLVVARPMMGTRMLWPAVGAATLGGLLTVGVGLLLDVAPAEYLVGISAFAVPVLVLVEAAAISSGADGTGRWVLMLAWGGIVFPLAALLPLYVTVGCAGTECALQDFGGALPLLVSAAAFVLLAWVPAGVLERPDPDRHLNFRAMTAILVLWAAAVVWLIQLEGAIDEFTLRILAAAVIGPAAAAVGWLVADRARGVPRPVVRSLVLGVIAGLVAVMPLAVTVEYPWTVVVGALAGALGSVAYSSKGSASAGIATRWGFVILVSAAVGFIAPAIAGDTVGILFSAHVDALTVPIVSFLGVALVSVVVSAPAWVLVRRHSSLEWVPSAIRVDTVPETDASSERNAS